jgi:hypothetical protein
VNGPTLVCHAVRLEDQLVRLIEHQAVEGGNQRIGSSCGNLPDEGVVDGGVTVDQHIAERDDPGQVGDISSGELVNTTQPVESLTDDLELGSTADRSIASDW